MTTTILEIPLNRLKPSPQNARRTALLAGLEALAASIAAHGLLQMPVVAAERDAEGKPTGCYRVTAGERRRKALLLLVQQKHLKKTAPIACLVRDDGNALELSLAENVAREVMHPADQFEAFAALRDGGMGPEAIAARFGVTPAVVRQRLKLAAVSPGLMARYRDGEFTLDQLMAFAVTDDHALQDEVFATLSWNRSPETIRRALTARHVSPRDRRAVFIGAEAYEAAGGTILRDLFTEDHGGWLTDSLLLDRLVREKLEGAAATVKGEGWQWVDVLVDHPHGSAFTQVRPHRVPLAAEDQARLEALTARYDALFAEHEGTDDLPDEVQAEIETLDAAIEALQRRQLVHASEDIARAGAIVALGTDGTLRIERGLVRPEDQPKMEPAAGASGDNKGEVTGADGSEPQGLRPLSDALVAELTAQRTMALQESLAAHSDLALLALTHALALRTFRGGWAEGSCLGIEVRTPDLEGASPGIGGSRAGEAMARRGEEWTRAFADGVGLWDWLVSRNPETRLRLLAYCVARTVDAVRHHDGRRQVLAHADRLAEAIGLDMTAWWEPTGERYLGRVPKTRILEAVREGVAERDAASIAGLKKDAMIEHAERLLAGKGWLPELLRPPVVATPAAADRALKAAE